MKSSAERLGYPSIIRHTITILAFKEQDTVLVSKLATGIKEKLNVTISISSGQALPDFAFYQPRQRYIADSLLLFLQRFNNGRTEKIIGITAKDISTRKGPHENWGILGLGSCPGEACIISTFRAGKNKVSVRNFTRRMITLALHELGHTYGLEHCPENTCLMKDADGKMNLDDGDSYCQQCKKNLAGMGVLK